MSAVPAAAWFPDPEDPTMLRWWDGGAWTEHRHPVEPAAPAAQQPQLVMVPVPMAGAAVPGAQGAPHFSEEHLRLQREQLELQRRQMELNEARAQRMEQRSDEREGGVLERLDDAMSIMRFARMFGIGR